MMMLMKSAGIVKMIIYTRKYMTVNVFAIAAAAAQ